NWGLALFPAIEDGVGGVASRPGPGEQFRVGPAYVLGLMGVGGQADGHPQGPGLHQQPLVGVDLPHGLAQAGAGHLQADAGVPGRLGHPVEVPVQQVGLLRRQAVAVDLDQVWMGENVENAAADGHFRQAEVVGVGLAHVPAHPRLGVQVEAPLPQPVDGADDVVPGVIGHKTADVVFPFGNVVHLDTQLHRQAGGLGILDETHVVIQEEPLAAAGDVVGPLQERRRLHEVVGVLADADLVHAHLLRLLHEAAQVGHLQAFNFQMHVIVGDHIFHSSPAAPAPLPELKWGRMTTRVSTMFSVPRSSASTSGGTGSSKASTMMASPRTSRRATCMAAMLTPWRPRMLPTRPIMPGRSWCRVNRRQCPGTMSMGRPSRLVRRTVPSTLRVADTVRRGSVRPATLMTGPTASRAVSVRWDTSSPRRLASKGAFTRFTGSWTMPSSMPFKTAPVKISTARADGRSAARTTTSTFSMGPPRPSR